MQPTDSLCAHGIKIHQFKAKDSETKSYPLCFGNISKDLEPIT